MHSQFVHNNSNKKCNILLKNNIPENPLKKIKNNSHTPNSAFLYAIYTTKVDNLL